MPGHDSSAAEQPVAVNDCIPPWKYYKAANNTFLQAKAYRQSGNARAEYDALFRYANLVLHTIPRHRDARQYAARHEGYREMLRTRVVPRLEVLKPLVAAQAAAQAHAPAAAHRREGVVQLASSNLPQLDWAPAQVGAAAAASPPPNFKEANATVERLMSGAAQQNGAPADAHWAPAADPLDPFAASGSIAPPPPPTYPAAQGALALPTMPAWALAGSTSYGPRSGVNRHSLLPSAALPTSVTVAPQAQRPLYPSFDTPPTWPPPQDPPRVMPLPPQELPVAQQVVTEMPLILPGDTCEGCTGAHSHDHAPHAHEHAPHPPAPAPEPTVLEAAMNKVKTDLRDVYISPPVMEQFLRCASRNTSQGIEFCGILAGVLSSDDSSFTVTTLIIPKQKGEANTVEMLNEEELFDYQYERGLMPLGWIHTHPTQTCFLSSIDVHTQCGYQVMLSEAIAIVMAPTDSRQKCGIFRLTTPGGMSVVQQCQERGFHQHPTPDTKQEIYELCGHVFLDETAKFECIDLR